RREPLRPTGRAEGGSRESCTRVWPVGCAPGRRTIAQWRVDTYQAKERWRKGAVHGRVRTFKQWAMVVAASAVALHRESILKLAASTGCPLSFLGATSCPLEGRGPTVAILRAVSACSGVRRSHP